MRFNPRQIVALIKGSPEKVISWLLLIIFICLSSYLAVSWLRKTPSLSLDEMATRQKGRKPLTEAAILVDFGGLLTRKPITYYADIAQRNPFSKIPDLIFIPKEERRRKKIEQMEALLSNLNIAKEDYEKHLAKEYASTLQGLDLRNMEKELRRLTDLDGNPIELEKFRKYIKELGREKIKPVEFKPKGLYCTAIMSTVALIEGEAGSHWVKEGDEFEGWKVVRIDRDKKVVVLYKEEEKKELILDLGAGREERERARREAEEKRGIIEEEEGKKIRRRRIKREEGGILPLPLPLP